MTPSPPAGPQPPPPPPIDVGPAAGWQHLPLHHRIKDALMALPVYFTSRTVIDGLHAADLQTLNGPMGAAIEDQMVETLNALRKVWDPADEYPTFSFRRQPQTFPDVLLMREQQGAPREVLLGIELKGWYLLAKEEEPNFRLKQTEAACADADLLAIVPWALSNVLSGTAKVFQPFVVGTKYAAQSRNYHWQHTRETALDRGITIAEGAAPYPAKADKIHDVPAADSGNFGRIARSGLMANYCDQMLQRELAGVPANEWLKFFKKHGRVSKDP